LQLTQKLPIPDQAITIVHLLPHFANDGNGVVYAATDLACAQSDAGHSVTCIGNRGGSLEEVLQNRSVEAHVVEAFGLGPFDNFRSLARLFSLLKAIHPKVVHAHTIRTALIAKLLQPLLGYSLVASAHNGPRLKNFLLGVGDRVICVSAAVAIGMRRLHISESKLRVVKNGPLGSPRRAEVSASLSEVAISKPAIVTLAGLHTYKGVDDLIEAFAIARKTVPNLSLYILGEGPERRCLQMLAVRLNCDDRIHFEGFKSDPRPYLAHADVFVLPSHREAFGLSLAEAREARCAVIATNIGGIPEALEGGRSGILVAAKNPVEIGRVLVELFSDQKLLSFWQKRASENLSWLRVDRVSRETTEVYTELLMSQHQRQMENEGKLSTNQTQRRTAKTEASPLRY
jgi:glycosyltransferase involved in cell wall biosynthesis